MCSTDGAAGVGHCTGRRCRHRFDGRYRPRRPGRVRPRPGPAEPDTVTSGQSRRRRLRRPLSRAGVRQLGREGDARVELGEASIDGRLLPEASSALADTTYGPVVTTAEAIAARSSRWDPASGPSTDELRHVEQAKAAKAVLEEADRDLESFIGLRGVKAHVNELKYVQIYDRAMAARGVDIGQRNALHMTLIGPPGTAKTSIARIICKMYFGLGILKSPEFIEVSRKSLVGEHIGETESKTGAILDSARGRALFVDEAPELYKPDNDRDFGRIALDVIMKFAEDHRDDTMVALAGYAGGMNRLLSANPGLRSRFPTQLEFISYSRDELARSPPCSPLITASSSTPTRSHLPTAHALADHNIDQQPRRRSETLIDIAGNGRYVRNVMSEAVEKMKARVASDTSIDLATADLNLLRTVTNADMTDAIKGILASAESSRTNRIRDMARDAEVTALGAIAAAYEQWTTISDQLDQQVAAAAEKQASAPVSALTSTPSSRSRAR